jgi:glyceraldehyde 3-phosphate dehydrogenase
MAVKVAINGFGRIGRMVLRALYESNRTHEIQIVAVNDLGDAETNAHLTQYDTAHGKFPIEVGVEGGDLMVKGDRIKVCAERDPAKLPWRDLGVDLVVESTGLFTSKAKAGAHIAAGAKKVIISAPGDKDVDGTFVMGVHEDKLTAKHEVISNASCTTNCRAPLAKVLH